MEFTSTRLSKSYTSSNMLACRLHRCARNCSAPPLERFYSNTREMDDPRARVCVRTCARVKNATRIYRAPPNKRHLQNRARFNRALFEGSTALPEISLFQTCISSLSVVVFPLFCFVFVSVVSFLVMDHRRGSCNEIKFRQKHSRASTQDTERHTYM